MQTTIQSPVFTPADAITICGYVIEWFDTAANYPEPARDPATYTETHHRFPSGLPYGCTLHYGDSYGGQPVIIDQQHGIAYGLAV